VVDTTKTKTTEFIMIIIVLLKVRNCSKEKLEGKCISIEFRFKVLFVFIGLF